MKHTILIAAFLCAAFTCGILACENCKCQGNASFDLLSSSSDDANQKNTDKSQATDSTTPGTPSATPSSDELASKSPGYKWSFDTLWEYVSYKHQSVAWANAVVMDMRDPHGFLREYKVTQRFAYNINSDLQVSLAQGYRSLDLREIYDSNTLGEYEHSRGPTDLDFGLQYRFLHQRQDGCPVDLSVFADIKAPTGQTNNLRPNGELFEAEDQPGTGSWDEMGGLLVGKRFGNWGASASYCYTHKGEGIQLYKAGDVNRLTISASHKISPDDWKWRIFVGQGVQGFIENKAVGNGMVMPDCGGQFIYAIPSISLQPNRHLFLTASGSVPIYQQENGFNQKANYAVQLNFGVRF